MARQPEVAGSIQTAMIIAAALIEGFTFYALGTFAPRNESLRRWLITKKIPDWYAICSLSPVSYE